MQQFRLLEVNLFLLCIITEKFSDKHSVPFTPASSSDRLRC
jgi:hypothetical protein